VTEGLEEVLLDKDTDGEGGATREIRRGIGVPFGIGVGFVVDDIEVGRGSWKVITLPGICRSIICAGMVLGERLFDITPGSMRKRLRRTKTAEIF
jgi:hypothetical protein